MAGKKDFTLQLFIWKNISWKTKWKVHKTYMFFNHFYTWCYKEIFVIVTFVCDFIRANFTNIFVTIRQILFLLNFLLFIYKDVFKNQIIFFQI